MEGASNFMRAGTKNTPCTTAAGFDKDGKRDGKSSLVKIVPIRRMSVPKRREDEREGR